MPPCLSTRRELAAAVLAGAAGGALSSLVVPAAADAQAPPSDPQLGADLVAMELLAIAVYERVLASRCLSERATRDALTILAHEHAHASAVRAELVALGGTSPQGPRDDDEIDERLSARHVSGSVSDLHDEHACLDLLLDTERAAEGTYYAAMAKLHNPRLMILSARILGSEAQHEAVLGQLRRGKDFSRAVPYAFVEGIRQ